MRARRTLPTTLALAGCCLCVLVVAGLFAQTATYDERYRPQFHFTPAVNWTNDPNGLVYDDGEWHLFYQYNPFGDVWGHMSWGHAVSSDLFHWKHLDVAIPEAGPVMAFSGSAVVDAENTAGFGKDALVAIYTSRTQGDQTQSLAYSNDRGRTWKQHEGNPVLDVADPAFRDPKVFWHERTKRWVMAVVLANQRKASFYASTDLKRWAHLSDFGPQGAHPVANWECPDLFELPIEGESGESKWVFQVDSGRGHPWVGSGCQYFVGEFDGTTFTNDNPPETQLWLDWGRDFYAAQSYANVPEADGRRLVIGWISNWLYARETPTSPWRGAQSIARELGLRRYAEGLRVVQRPAREIEGLRAESIHIEAASIERANERIREAAFAGDVVDIEVEIDVGDVSEVGLRILASGEEATLVGFTARPAEVYIDRTKSGEVDFHETFAGRHAARLMPEDRRIQLRVLVDRSVVEVFAGDGRVAITDRVFPKHGGTGLSLFAKGGEARVVRLQAWKLRSVWNP